jgi:hypothetical protein
MNAKFIVRLFSVSRIPSVMFTFQLNYEYIERTMGDVRPHTRFAFVATLRICMKFGTFNIRTVKLSDILIRVRGLSL